MMNKGAVLATLFSILFFQSAFGQLKIKGTFIGSEPIEGMQSTNRGKWFHLSKLTFTKDSVFLEQSPIVIYKKDTSFSASDGGFYSYAGTLKKYKGKTIADLELIDCDYCANQIIKFTPPIIVDDLDSAASAKLDTLSNFLHTDSASKEESATMTFNKKQYKVLFISYLKSQDLLQVNQRFYKRQKKQLD